jgi:copper homeostasis protein
MAEQSQTVLFEACVDSVASAVVAADGGAGRLELCDNLVEGGTTPSAGMIARCVARVAIPVCVMIRPRGGDFLYDADEVAVMELDIDGARVAGAAGVVFGALTADGMIDADLTRRLVKRARPLPVIFHRAFDMTRDLSASLDTLIALGVDRILTSGGGTTALEGVETLAALVAQSAGRIAIMAGVGVRASNVAELVRRSGVREVHARLTETVGSGMQFRAGTAISLPFTPNEYERLVTSRLAVAAIVAALRS